MRRWLWLGLLAVACGNTDGGQFDAPPTVADAAIPDAPPGIFDAPRTTAGCAVEITGSASDELGCSVTAGKQDDETTSVFALTAGSGSTSLTLTLRVEGTLEEGTFVASGGAASVMIGGNSYIATKGSENDVGTIGTLQITLLEPVSTSGGVTVWAPHGSISASLVSPTNPDSRITLSATF